jgi:hypothetical protein
MKENRRKWTCKRSDLQTLGSQPAMPKNLPEHWGRVNFFPNKGRVVGGGWNRVTPDPRPSSARLAEVAGWTRLEARCGPAVSEVSRSLGMTSTLLQLWHDVNAQHAMALEMSKSWGYSTPSRWWHVLWMTPFVHSFYSKTKVPEDPHPGFVHNWFPKFPTQKWHSLTKSVCKFVFLYVEVYLCRFFCPR